METMALVIKDGDIFNWRYTDEKKHSEDYAYWCCSRIMVARDGWVRDTYWSDNDGHRGHFPYEEAVKKCTLKFLGNFNDLEKINRHEKIYYDEKDIVDITHSNAGEQCYKRKGATKSREVMISRAKDALERWEWRVKSDQQDLERAKSELEAASGDGNLEKIYLRVPN
jgi:hypothetical protein